MGQQQKVKSERSGVTGDIGKGLEWLAIDYLINRFYVKR